MTSTHTIPVPTGPAPGRGFRAVIEALGLSSLGSVAPMNVAARARLFAQEATASANERLRLADWADAEAARARADGARSERLGPEIEWIP